MSRPPRPKECAANRPQCEALKRQRAGDHSQRYPTDDFRSLAGTKPNRGRTKREKKGGQHGYPANSWRGGSRDASLRRSLTPPKCGWPHFATDRWGRSQLPSSGRWRSRSATTHDSQRQRAFPRTARHPHGPLLGRFCAALRKSLVAFAALAPSQRDARLLL